MTTRSTHLDPDTGSANNLRVLFDVLGSPKESGGMRLHAEKLIESWSKAFPMDQILVIGPEWTRATFKNLPNVRVQVWPNERVLQRSSGQLVVSALAALRFGADFVVSLSPIVSPLVGRSRAVCFEHDWRHIKNPWEFSTLQRWYRKLWNLSARRAGLVACISEKTVAETLALIPSARTTLVPNGRDHAASWVVPAAPNSEHRSIVTFGHHNNKRPELVIEAISALPDADRSDLRVHVLGAKGTYRTELEVLASALGVRDHVMFPGFVAEDEYQSLIANADVIVLASSDEGFGLPVAEAQYFGIPVVLTADSGVVDLHGPSVLSAEPTGAGLAQAISAGLRRGRAKEQGNRVFGWADAARMLRAAMGQLSKPSESAVKASE